jgi:hypothetical protein
MLLPSGQQVNVGSGGQRLTQALTRILLQKPEHAADFWQREALAAQLRNQRDFYYFFGPIDALVTVLAGRDDFPFVPPLQLPKADAANLGHIARVVALLPRCSDRPGTPGFKYFGALPFPSTNQCYQMDCTFAAAGVTVRSTPAKSHSASFGRNFQRCRVGAVGPILSETGLLPVGSASACGQNVG